MAKRYVSRWVGSVGGRPATEQARMTTPTPSGQAAELARREAERITHEFLGKWKDTQSTSPALIDSIATALTRGRAEAMEVCAKIADEYRHHYSGTQTGDGIAAEIRALAARQGGE